jgi:hypothetical protein
VENLWISCLNAAASAAESVASLGRLRPGEDVAFPTRLRRVDCFSSHTRLKSKPVPNASIGIGNFSKLSEALLSAELEWTPSGKRAVGSRCREAKAVAAKINRTW